MDVERFQQAVLTVITSVACTIQDPDDLLELSDFLAREVQDSGVILPDVVEDAATNNVSSQRSLEELESMPITNIIGPHLVDMLDIPSTHVPIVIDEILDAYIAGETSEPSQIVESQGFDKERLCELCDRPAFLTDHHLIPRSEHDLFVKRGVFTLQECTLRQFRLCCSFTFSDDRNFR